MGRNTTKRLNKTRKQKREVRPRGPLVIGAVFSATIEELAQSGYGGLSMDAVATRAGVAKTTVYRRWPTRSALVLAAISAGLERAFVGSDTGSLAGDLFELASGVRTNITGRAGRGVVLALTAEDAAIRRLAHKVRKKGKEAAHRILRRAIERDELPASVDQALLLDSIFGALQQRIIFDNARADDAYLERLIALALAGARAVSNS